MCCNCVIQSRKRCCVRGKVNLNRIVSQRANILSNKYGKLADEDMHWTRLSYQNPELDREVKTLVKRKIDGKSSNSSSSRNQNEGHTIISFNSTPSPANKKCANVESTSLTNNIAYTTLPKKWKMLLRPEAHQKRMDSYQLCLNKCGNIATMINQSYSTLHIASICKTARIVPLSKPNKLADKLLSYTPISEK